MAGSRNVMGFIFSLILIVGVAIPIASTIITTANLTGIPATIVGFVTTFLALGGLYMAAATTGMLG
jgi:Ca2+/Na+ antiporter